MKDVFYGVQSKSTEETKLLEYLSSGFDLVLVDAQGIETSAHRYVRSNTIGILRAGNVGEIDEHAKHIKGYNCNSFCFKVEWDQVRENTLGFRRALQKLVASGHPGTRVSVLVPVEQNLRNWVAWSEIKVEGLSVVLGAAAAAASDVGENKVLRRWLTEPVSCFLLDDLDFFQAEGYPILHQSSKTILQQVMECGPCTIIVNSEEYARDYLRYLKWYIPKVPIDKTCDLLIEPLQPLRDNLASEIYEVFEKDENKYQQYARAVALALEDLQGLNLKILVVGPGRGPLVDIVYSELRRLGLEIQVDAVEKNPNCIEILRHRNTAKWANSIRVFHGDVRNLSEYKYDVVVSELLGSFGCNELCPDILQEFQHTQAIMIPQSYSSYLQGIYSLTIANIDKDEMERPYLLKPQRYYTMTETARIWTYHHPGTNYLSKQTQLQFQISTVGKLNAFQGFFVATLYGDIQIGIHPGLKLHEYCQSWYPIIFPIQELACKANSLVDFKIERCVSNDVFYKWAIRDRVYNERGTYSIAL